MLIVDEIKALTKLQKAIFVAGASMAAVGGAVVGYTVALRTLNEKLREEADEAIQEEIQKTKDILESVKQPTQEFQTPEEALAALHPEKSNVETATEALLKYAQKHELEQVDEIQKFLDRPLSESIREDAENEGLIEVAENVFTNHAVEHGEWIWADEIEDRDPDTPYIIHRDEFNGDEFGYSQTQMTYFEGDGVLMEDVRGERVDDIAKMVGASNLTKFGHGSDDENVVYIRNVPLEMEIEVTRSPGKYAVEVLGFDDSDSLSHSSDYGIRKFRNHDG